MITFDRVSFRYDENKETSPSIGEVSFSWRKGEVIGLLGGNGAGKSTLSLLATGLLQPSEGTVLVSGIDTKSGDPEIQRLVGIMLQNPDNQIVGTTVEEDLAFGLENLGVPTDQMRERVNYISKCFHLEGWLKSPIQQLSGGMKQRLALASVMVMEPEFLILDEPTSHLDPWLRSELWGMLDKIVTEQGLGILLISQRGEDFNNVSRIIVLAEGKLVFSGIAATAWDDDRIDLWNVPVPPSIILQQKLSLKAMRSG